MYILSTRAPKAHYLFPIFVFWHAFPVATFEVQPALPATVFVGKPLTLTWRRGPSDNALQQFRPELNALGSAIGAVAKPVFITVGENIEGVYSLVPTRTGQFQLLHDIMYTVSNSEISVSETVDAHTVFVVVESKDTATPGITTTSGSVSSVSTIPPGSTPLTQAQTPTRTGTSSSDDFTATSTPVTETPLNTVTPPTSASNTSPATIIGSVIGVLATIATAVVLTLFIRRRNHRAQQMFEISPLPIHPASPFELPASDKSRRMVGALASGALATARSHRRPLNPHQPAGTMWEKVRRLTEMRTRQEREHHSYDVRARSGNNHSHPRLSQQPREASTGLTSSTDLEMQARFDLISDRVARLEADLAPPVYHNS
ncbi:hypothetical protein PM082_019565 [Marasmius tenuissimus]|nr:hypothetical protein PM082_019565 [Marasmius tenuissimus]